MDERNVMKSLVLGDHSKGMCYDGPSIHVEDAIGML